MDLSQKEFEERGPVLALPPSLRFKFQLDRLVVQ
jgi:hypothetical protein